MVVWLLDCLAANWPAAMGPCNALGKVTFRAALAALLSFALALAFGPRLIAWLRVRFREPIRGRSAMLCQLHQAKQWTPTMGGLFIVLGLLAGGLVFGDLGNTYIWLALLVVVGLAMLGAADDLAKLRGTGNGLSVRGKILGQLVVASLVATLLYYRQAELPGGLETSLPLLGSFSLGWMFVPLAVLVIVGFSNAVNLTDGLDGLAGGCLVAATAAMAVMTYAGGHAELAAYLHVPRVTGAGEMVVLAAATIGGVMGFLWFNCHPAQVFMGDTGSLPLGGLLGLMAVIARQELLLLVAGGVFVAEAMSVVLQVGCFRLAGRRLFRCAPLHHHFQFKGVAESKIVVRFWIAAALCAIVGVAGLKLNVAESPQRPAVLGSTESRDSRVSALDSRLPTLDSQ